MATRRRGSNLIVTIESNILRIESLERRVYDEKRAAIPRFRFITMSTP